MPGYASPLDAALHYAALGWHVFPCKANKHPYTEHGHLDATTEEASIVAWWRRWPDAQVGVACGASKLCVIDLDYDRQKKIDGPSYFARLEEEHGPDWCELIASSPRGGRHLVYRMPAEPVRSRNGAIPGSGIDVKADGGYVIVPSPASPGREWVTGEPGEANLTEPPEWIERIILQSARRGSAHASSKNGQVGAAPETVLLEEQVEAIRSALQHVDPDPRETWIRVGMALKSTGAGQKAYDLWVEWSSWSPKYDAKVQLQQWRSLREFFLDGHEITLGTLFHLASEGGWVPSAEVSAVATALEVGVSPPAQEAKEAKKAKKAKKGRRRPGSEKKAFPRELLNCPGLVGDIAAWLVSCSTRPQPAMCLASSIVTVGAVLGRRVATSTDLRTNVYCLGIGDTGCGKDVSVRLPAMLLERAGLGWAVGPGEWKSDSGLRAALLDAPSHAAYIDEFTVLLENMAGDRVPPHVRGIKRYLLDLYGASNSAHQAPAYADRKTSPPVVIEQPNLCIYGTGVPAKLFGSLDRGAVSDGFLNRILVFFADETFPQRQKVGRAEPPSELVEQLALLAKATAVGDLAGMAQAAPEARIVPCTAEGEQLLDDLTDGYERRCIALRAAGNPLADLWVRAGAQIAKLALIRAVGDDPDREIDARDVTWAQGVVEWCSERMATEADDRVADSKHESDVLRVRRIIDAAGEGGLSASQLTRQTQWLRRHDRTDIVRTLVEGGSVETLSKPIDRATKSGKSRGSVPVTAYRITGYEQLAGSGEGNDSNGSQTIQRSSLNGLSGLKPFWQR